jgi:hypothetical protein
MKAAAGQRALARFASKRQTGASNHRFQGNAGQAPCGVRFAAHSDARPRPAAKNLFSVAAS